MHVTPWMLCSKDVFLIFTTFLIFSSATFLSGEALFSLVSWEVSALYVQGEDPWGPPHKYFVMTSQL